MTATSKRKILFFYSITLILAMAIAAGLHKIDFQPGMALPDAGSDRSTVVIPQSGDASVAFPILRFIATLFLVTVGILVMIAVARLLSGIRLKGLKPFFVKSGIGIAAGLVFVTLLFSLFPRAPDRPAVELPPAMPVFGTTPQDEPPASLGWLLALGIGAIVVAAAVWLLSIRPGSKRGQGLVGLEAEAARRAILEGKDLKDVITTCYREMGIALAMERGLERKSSMTAREFEAMLAEGGVPRASVHRLTLLFEAVRYGDWRASPSDEAEAIECLEAIEKYAWSGKGKP